MYKQELPMIYPDDAAVERVRQAFFDPFEYLMLRHEAGLLNTAFKQAARQSRLPCLLPSAGAEHRRKDA